MDFRRMLASNPRKHDQGAMEELGTPWGHGLGANQPLSLHPHPQFERGGWLSLNGSWDCGFAKDPDPSRPLREMRPPSSFDQSIAVPFSPEARLSGVGRQLQPDELLWYRRSFSMPAHAGDERIILHFEAVDYACFCLVNGVPVGEHVGSYLPFSWDITDFLHGAENELALCVRDPSDRGVQLRGKQRLERGSIWYTAQSGIWQSVWLEVVPAAHVVELRLAADPDAGELHVSALLSTVGQKLRVSLVDHEGSVVSYAEEKVTKPEAILVLSVKGPRLWSPEDPYLYGVRIEYGTDAVRSYCAFRTVGIERDDNGVPRFFLNHRPLFLRGLLDQGYWPDGLMTAPSEEALAFDIQTARSLGFNMLRKHIKVEADRWYALCDRLGMLVWQDMPSGGSSPYNAWQTSQKPTLFRGSWTAYQDRGVRHQAGLSAGDGAYRREWLETCQETIRCLGNHPCIVTWVLFNEGWGQFDARAAVRLVRSLDSTRPIDATSGWYDQGCGDYFSVHNYFRKLRVYRVPSPQERAFVISEFGGLPWHVEGHSTFSQSYGYANFESLEEWRVAVRNALAQADALEDHGLAGYVYTQLSDVEEETNGLLTYDRKVSKLVP